MSAAALRQLVQELWQRQADLEHQIRERDAEIARLKGLAGRPVIKPAAKPSGMEAGTQPARDRPARRGRAGKVSKTVTCEDRVLCVAVPEGSRFKGYEDFTVQELEVRARLIRFRRERWVAPDGRTLVAPLPAGGTGATSGRSCSVSSCSSTTAARPPFPAWKACWAISGWTSPSARSCAC